MSQRFTRRESFALAAGAAALAAPPVLAAEPEVTLRLHQFLPLTSFVPAHILTPWIKAVEEASQGRVRIQHYPSMQLGGKPTDLIDQVTDGVVDIVWTLPGYTPGRFPRTEVMELPFLVAEAEAASAALWELAQAEMVDTDFRDIHLLGTWVHGPGVIHANKSVRAIPDFEGLKLRGPSRVTTKLLEHFGATAVEMPVPAVPEALSHGTIDGALLPWEVSASLRIGELVHHHTQFAGPSIYTASFILAMNKDRYAALDPDLQAAIDSVSGVEFSAQAGHLQQAEDIPSRQAAMDLGNEIITIPAEDTSIWKDASQPVIDAWVAEMEENGVPGETLLSSARALIEKHSF
ncbi:MULTISPECIES: TRAP transporter substrate-binding protein [Thioclava]|uniref:TRAP transporter substrate-binding protein n=1 Tax=Thioclava TaxID=285107 RepID=UPI000C544763|nr:MULTISPECIES: TRAP transporter substrate-binding protein [Thioclava]MAQ38915.1 C4-dicarboxylate ABC transporter [Thioclava sp.]|tara:strand:+ start:874 stop:1917 length:1044 start_codon:yes stop_codon:yes gene_type:complete